jgi:hypothetical protein
MMIAKCTNESCHIKKRCRRYIDIPKERQVYAHFHLDSLGMCSHYIPTKAEQKWQAFREKEIINSEQYPSIERTEPDEQE